MNTSTSKAEKGSFSISFQRTCAGVRKRWQMYVVLSLPPVQLGEGGYPSFSADKEGRISPTFGKVSKFSPEKLRALYGSLDKL